MLALSIPTMFFTLHQKFKLSYHTEASTMSA